MSVPAALKFTYEDYALLPEDRRYEVVDGELFLTPAPTTFHQLVCASTPPFCGAEETAGTAAIRRGVTCPTAS